MQKNLRTNLAKAKGIGSAKNGFHHWWYQRLTSIMMTPLLLWMLYFIKNNTNQDLSNIISNIHKPYNIIPILILIVLAFYHGMLGIRVIIEDYFPNVKIRSTLIILTQLFSIITVVTVIVAILTLISI